MSEPGGREIGRRIVDAVKGYVARSIAPSLARIKLLEEALQKSGAPGKEGAPGRDGLNGKDGAPGINGKDGAPGRDGVDGKDGERGATGIEGKDGTPGAPGRLGEKGDPGKDGRDGRDGKDGAAGRDALSLDILPAIDEARSYPRGTFARHANGLWRAAGDTQGMRGWECIVAGVAAFSVKQEEDRKFFVSLQLSGGDVMVTEFTLPMVIDRGVYRADCKYAQGDGVTYAGSFWISKIDSPALRPGDPADNTGGEPKQWRLSVKRGQNGKDAK